LHSYRPHIPQFEKNYGVNDDMDFATLRSLVLQEGYASTYILAPALEGRADEVFFTLWDYDRLQQLWAREHGLRTRNRDAIKLAQIEEFKPDVFYNMSAFCDDGFIRKLGRSGMKRVYWNGIIEARPRTFLQYDGQLSLHRPYIEYWKSKGLAACELQPAIPAGWAALAEGERDIDVLFYGQYMRSLFKGRNRLLQQLMQYGLSSEHNIRCHLQCDTGRPTIFRIPGLEWTRIRSPFARRVEPMVSQCAQPPLYGRELYRAIARSRIVINAYTDNNQEFKSNMRLFEATGLGAFLISEQGNYPEGFEPGNDFYTYRDGTELFSQIERVLQDWPRHAAIAGQTREKVSALYNKERQWRIFRDFIASL
jgi:hypothetical protein